MANPVFQEGSLPRRKQPAEALGVHDSVLPVQNYGKHNATPPTLADGDVASPQLDDMGNLKMTFGDPAILAQLIGSGIFPVMPGWKRQNDYDTRTDYQPVYLGFALMAALESEETWHVFKFTYSGNQNTKVESAYGSWTGRALLFS